MLSRRTLLIACLSAAACGRPSAGDEPSRILLFSGAGTSSGDVTALKRILEFNHLSYVTASSHQLDAMSEDKLATYDLLIVPGGNFEDMGNRLAPATSGKVREAVQGGLNYLGICAGGFIAGNSPYNGFNLTDGVRFGFYSIEAQGIRRAAVLVNVAGSSVADHYWEDGPQFTGWGDVVAKYPDGTPAIVEGSVGEGWVILIGTHPEAPESWRRGMTFKTPVGENTAYTATLIDAALSGARLPHF